MITADQASIAATTADEQIHNVTAIKIEAADEPPDPIADEFYMEEGDVGE